MTADRDPPRDLHRLFGMLLTDFSTGSPFTVEVESDLSRQQQGVRQADLGRLS